MGAQAAALCTGRIYPGMGPFEAEECTSFFTREEETDELLPRLEDTRFPAVVGLSGAASPHWCARTSGRRCIADNSTERDRNGASL